MKWLRFCRGWIILSGLFVREFALSVWDVSLTVLNPARAGQSAIVAVPLDVESEAGIVIFANMITLTPGTITLHISEDRKTLYVHVMNYSPDVAANLKAGFEHCVREVLP